MAALKLTACMKVVAKMGESDQDLLLERLDRYAADGIPRERAQVMAAADTLAELEAERNEFMATLREQHPDLFVVTNKIPEDQDVNPDEPDIKRSTSRWNVTDDGLTREAAERIVKARTTGRQAWDGYEFKIEPSQFHTNGTFQIEARKLPVGDIKRSTKRGDYKWKQKEVTADGPILGGDGFFLLPQRQINQDDFGEGGFASSGLMGHAERVVPNTKTYAFRVVSPNGSILGTLVSDVDSSNNIRSIHDIDVGNKMSGLGSRLVATIAANVDSPIKIQDITNEAEPFWTRIGAGYKDTYGDAFIDWSDVSGYLRSRGASGVDSNPASAQVGDRGLQEGSYKVRELSPEEAAGIKFSTRRDLDAFGRMWAEYATDDNGFKFGRSPDMLSKDLSDIAKAFSTKGARISQSRTPMFDGEVMIELNGDADNGSMMLKKSGGNRYKISAADARPGSDALEGAAGQRMYQTLLQYAINNGLVVDADFELSPVNQLRRTTALLSAALRNGTTDFIGRVHPDQGVRGLLTGDFWQSVGALARAEMEKIDQRIGAFSDLSIDSDGKIYAGDEAATLIGGDLADRTEPMDTRSGTDQSRAGIRGDRQAGSGGRDSARNDAGEANSRRDNRSAQGDAHKQTRGPDTLGDGVAGSPVADSELVDYLARTGGGFAAHGVGLNTLKRALITKSWLGGGSVNSQPGLLFSKKRDVTETPEFKRWFGDSKVVVAVNADTGQPLVSSKEPKKFVPQVMYHTTRNDFSEFEIGRLTKNSGTFGDWETSRAAVFVTPELGASEAYGKSGGQFAAGANVMPLYVKAENPLDLSGGFIPQRIADRFDEIGFNSRWLYQFDWSKFDGEEGKDFVEAAKKLGYDSVIFNDENPDTGESFEAYALFSPTQLKSAIGNSGQFDPENPDIRRSRRRNAMGFYSALTEEIENLPTKQAPAGAWKTQIKGLINKGAIKQEELTWSGLEDWLDLQEGKISKEAVLGYLEQGGVQVEEVRLGGSTEMSSELRAYMEDVGRPMPQAVGEWADEAQMAEATASRMEASGRRANADRVRAIAAEMRSINKSTGGGTKYSKYTLPGGENYREVLLTLPVKQVNPTEDEARRNELEGKNNRGQITKAEFAELLELRKAPRADDRVNYKSNHWDQPNVIAHIRVNDRTDADGERVLFVEEVQSDWGQDGKKKGFSGDRGMRIERRAGPNPWFVLDKDGAVVATKASEQAAQMFIRDQSAGLPPLAPFVTKTEGWLNLALKRVITMAAEGGYDKVAFVNGQQSADRYDLSKQVKSIGYTPNGDGTYKLYANGMNNETIVDEKRADMDRIEALVGKEIATKIANGEGRPMQGSGPDTGFRSLTGLDLKIGGEGMKTFYDQIVPLALKKLLPKVGGGQMRNIELSTGNGNRYNVINMNTDEVVYRSNSNQDAREFVLRSRGMLQIVDTQDVYSKSEPSISGQPGFDITDSMREKVESGLPLFSKKRAFHGTPRGDISQFSTDFVGQGEGVQAFGWGLYFADKEAVADYYRRSLSDSSSHQTLIVNGQKLDPNSPERHAASLLYWTPKSQIKKAATRWVKEAESGDIGMADTAAKSGLEPAEYWQRLLDFVNNHTKRDIKAERGQIYEVEIPGDEDMLLWHEPINKQNDPDLIRQIAEDIDLQMQFRKKAMHGDRTGEDFYRAVSQEMGGDRWASKYLASWGIKGIKYLDGDSRTGVTGSNNYVIFDGADVEIVGAKFSKKRNPQVDTPEFKRWFGDSKVVDSDGNPLVVHHGTDKEFSSFDVPSDGGVFFTSSKPIAKEYASRTGKEPATVVDAYLSIRNPFIVDAGGDFWDDVNIGGMDYPQAELRRIFPRMTSTYTTEDIAAAVKKAGGYDGVIIRGVKDAPTGKARKSDVFIAFEPTQIKSATNNSGAFDPSDPDIRRSTRRVTETPEFRRWFGDSKVVDGEGRPLVVYHGTASDFDSFTPSDNGEWGRGIYFTNLPDAASKYAEARGKSANVIPVYASVRNPANSKQVAAARAQTQALMRDGKIRVEQRGGEMQRILESQGFDGVIVRSGKGNMEVVAFRPEQIKSAIGNRGTFDPTNPDIRRSTGRTATGAAWDSPSASKWDDLVYKMQDKQVELKRVVSAIKEASGAIADDLNAYLQEELFHGRAAKRTEDFVNMELNPLVEQLAKDGLKLEDVEEFMHARHAPEANKVIAARNPGEPGLQDGGSGMKTSDALDYMANLQPDLKLKLELAAAKVDAIISKTRQMYVDYELESQETVDAWGRMFQYYIPLMREDKDGTGSPGIGQGFSVKGKETKGRTGSTRKVVDILANIAMQRERVIVRGEKNRVSQALVGLAEANPNPGFWRVDEVPTERVYDERLGVVVDRPDPMWKSRPNTVVTKVRGPNGEVKERAVTFNEEDERAMRMAASLKNIDAEALEGLLGVSAAITRYFASINTQYNPIFGAVNLIRDVQGAILNLSTTPIAGDGGKIARNTFSALLGIYGDTRSARKGKSRTSAWAQLWDEFQDVGGQTGYRDLFRTSADRADAIKSTLDPDAWMDSKLGKIFTANGALRVPMGKAKRGATWIFDWLSDYNLAMENGVRLAAYKAGLERGLSKEQAASIAKNLTVNFNRRGQVGLQAGALYAFFNAAMQGTARMAETLTEMEPGKPKTMRLSSVGKKIVYGGILLGSIQALALAAAGYNEEDPPQFARERGLIIPLPGGKYFTIPMPLGFHVIPNIGRIATEFALSGFKDPHERAIQLVGMFADTFNPIGNAGLSMQTLAPTALDPLVALTENRDWTGKPITRESMNPATPGTALARDTATTFSKLLAEAINTASGGNQYVAGVFSPTPDQIDYLIGQLTGGVGRELSKIEQSVLATARGEELPTFKIPLLGRFIGDTRQQASEGSAFYANTARLNELETEIKGLQKDGRYAEASELRRNNSDAYLIAMANQAERQIQRLRAQKRELIKKDASREQVKQIEDQITAVMARLNRAAERLREQQGN